MSRMSILARFTRPLLVRSRSVATTTSRFHSTDSSKPKFHTLTYETTDRIARIALNRPERGNGITLEMPYEIAQAVEMANLDPDIHVIALTGNGSGFCGGYDLVESAQRFSAQEATSDGVDTPYSNVSERSPVHPARILENHTPGSTWDPVTDYQLMHRNVRHFMALFQSDKPVIARIQGFCVGGGTDMALCCDICVIEDTAKIGYPPARVWGTPTSALWTTKIGHQRAMRMLLTGDCLTGAQAAEWGLCAEAVPRARLDEKFEALVERIARIPINQLVMQKILVNSTIEPFLATSQKLGVFFDGISRHTKEGYEFAQRSAEAGFKQAVRDRDQPFGDFGLTHRGRL